MELARGERPCTVEWEPEGVSSPGSGAAACRGTRQFVLPGMDKKAERHPAASSSRLYPRNGGGQVCRERRSGESPRVKLLL